MTQEGKLPEPRLDQISSETLRKSDVVGRPCGSNQPRVIMNHLWDRYLASWNAYRNLVLKYRIPLELADEGIDRLLFWMPYHENNGDSPPWREVLYGLLSLNRLSMHCAQEVEIFNSYGTTLRIERPDIPATPVRIALSVIHCLLPTLLEVVPSSPDPLLRLKEQKILRFRLEQVKFLLRTCILLSYWRQCYKKNTSSVCLGLMQDGGLFQVDQHPGISREEVIAMEKKRRYIGDRTGLKVIKESSLVDTKSRSFLLEALGELLYIFRPLYWASAEAKIPLDYNNNVASMHKERKSLALLKPLLASISIDLVSLKLLRQSCQNNPLSKEEWNRRRMKLFLYSLRSPIWSLVTSPVLERASSIIQSFPLFGRLIDDYLWDWILYHKHPYTSEEG